MTFELPITTNQAADFLLAAVKAEVENRSGEFNDDMRGTIYKVAEFLTNKSKKHSLLMCGKCGNGKTTLLKAIQTTFSFLDIHDENNQKVIVLTQTAKSLNEKAKTDFNSFKRLCSAPLLAIDDLGCEPAEYNAYGNVITPLIDLLEHRYAGQLPTIITTNLKPSEIGERYGERIADRFREIMEKITFTQNSYRC